MSEELKSVELSPCPFCGGRDIEPVQIDCRDREGTPHTMRCSNCGAESPWRYIDKLPTGLSILKEAWNNRPTEQESKWVSVDERLPENDGRFIIRYRQVNIERTFIADFCAIEERWLSFPEKMLVTHWMPLPKPPQEQTNDG